MQKSMHLGNSGSGKKAIDCRTCVSEHLHGRTKGEIYEELDLSGDELALIKAACDSSEIIINGKPFRPEHPIESNHLADLLNNCLRQPGQKVRFEFDDDSYLEVVIVSETHLGYSGTVWVECGRHECLSRSARQP